MVTRHGFLSKLWIICINGDCLMYEAGLRRGSLSWLLHKKQRFLDPKTLAHCHLHTQLCVIEYRRWARHVGNAGLWEEGNGYENE